MNTFTCDDKANLVAYLYGEIDPATRQAVGDHLARCAACAAEVAALGNVRSELGLWAPPDVELDFQIVRKAAAPPANVLRPARWGSTVPAWAQAAAAILVVAAGLSIANLRITSGPEGFSVTTGWMAPASSFDSTTTDSGRGLAQDRPAENEWKGALIALEQQLRTEIRAVREDQVRGASASSVDAATIRRVQQLIGEAEQRHERELAARFVDFTRDMNMQRRADLMKIGQGFVNYDDQLMRQRQMLNNVIRISATPQQ